ncbi:MAG: glycoside hydrolase family 88 protein [Prolixibacteraceae bacterium]|jgi:unsaturated rhamnogalacturonyl hydrolase|nr:glycoside hydrolase family 88 protein [Prolixibacteraceae bacterium]
MERLSGLILLLVLFSATSIKLYAEQGNNDDCYSIKMAQSVMERHPVVYDDWDYVTGTVMKAFQDLWLASGEQKYFDYIFRTVNKAVNADGSIKSYDISKYNIDEIREGSALLFLYEQTSYERYKLAADRLKAQLTLQPRTTEGGFWHKKRYPNQMWLDGLYMGSPFYAQYGKVFNDLDAFDDVSNQILLMHQHLKDSITGLYYHGWDESLEQDWADPVTGVSESFWGRGMGWFAMAIVDVLDYLPEDHQDRGEIIRILSDFVASISVYQDDSTGLWWQVVDKPSGKGNYFEASASCMYVYAIAKSVRLNYVDEKYQEIAKKGYRGILEHLISEQDGTLSLNNICRSAGLGYGRDGSYNYYINETDIVSNDGKGIGPFIMASLEFDSIAEMKTKRKRYFDYENDILYIYPNPASSEIVVDVKHLIPGCDLTIIDITGVVVKKIKLSGFGGNTVSINIQNLNNGVYFMRYNNNVTKRFLVKKTQ